MQMATSGSSAGTYTIGADGTQLSQLFMVRLKKYFNESHLGKLTPVMMVFCEPLTHTEGTDIALAYQVSTMNQKTLCLKIEKFSRVNSIFIPSYQGFKTRPLQTMLTALSFTP